MIKIKSKKESKIRKTMSTLGIFAVVLAVLAIGMAGTVEAKSMYLIADHHTAQFDAWNINPGGTVVYQATYMLSYSADPAGVAIAEEYDATGSVINATLFITSEFDPGVEIVDATTMTPIGSATGPSNLAGIDVDNANDIIYTLLRGSSDLYVYDWDPITYTLTPITGLDPITLPGHSGGFGIALDDKNGILWVTDTYSTPAMARAYDTTTWTEDTSKSFTPSHMPVDIAVDSQRGFVYTVSMSSGAGTGAGSTLLCKYDIATGTETMVDTGHEGVGVAVDEDTGYVYVTGGYYDSCGPIVDIWDTSTSPWTQVQTASVSGSPAGICIPRAGGVVFNPLNIIKDDGIPTGGSVTPGATIGYNICYDNAKNNYTVNNVTILDQLSTNLTFVSATGGGIYDSATHTVTWDIGTLPALNPQQCVQLIVTVNPAIASNTTVINSATINSNETATTTVTETTDVATTTGICFTIDLKAGWNAISFPVNMTNPSISNIFSGLSCYFVYTWDSVGHQYVKETGDVQVCEGYWVFVPGDTSITVCGIPVCECKVDLTAGWNMLGSIAIDTNIVNPNDMPDYSVWDKAYAWLPGGYLYIKTQNIDPCKGYWVLAFNDCTLTIEPAPPVPPYP
ncbi:MAG: DUF11 domain-containing protein [Methanosarcinales archaeon]|uniref:DUF11 domain-containing protein n=1 Tax=Candidatus Ethanoperedens thermophilum TaxID=2766897 RepID=A0A848D876_9EURY|nr:DUF11 domain-containing protein [Candidatus Ethanoperedens thermophilum]